MANDCSDGASHHILTLTNNDGSPQSRTHNLQNQVIAVGGANLSFDANGNMTVDEQGRTFIWDAWNRLVEVKQGSTTLVEYQYDGLKRRIIEDDGTDEKDLYYSDQWQVLEERVDGDTVTQYVWSAVYVDAMILRDRDADTNTGNGLEERIYVLHDANYNVTALVDTSGNVLERYYYEAYGQAVYLDDAFALLPDGQSDHGWQHLHQGGRLDTITGNYHFRNRDLSHSLGRWISQDPIGFEGSPWNLYEYVHGRPNLHLDPFGLEACGLSVWVYTGSWCVEDNVWEAAMDAAGGAIADSSFGVSLSADFYGGPVILEGGGEVMQVFFNPITGEYAGNFVQVSGGVGFGFGCGADFEVTFSPTGSPNDLAFGPTVYVEIDTPWGDAGYHQGSDYEGYSLGYGPGIGGGIGFGVNYGSGGPESLNGFGGNLWW